MFIVRVPTEIELCLFLLLLIDDLHSKILFVEGNRDLWVLYPNHGVIELVGGSVCHL